MTETPPHPTPAPWKPRSIALIVGAWLILHIGCLFTPGLLDDVDSVYIEIAREMLLRHDYVTPYIDGIRFFDKPPLMYWLAAGSMHLLGEHDWAARLPLALLTLALFLATYALGLRLFARSSPPEAPDRGALYSALALATSIGPFLYTRFFIPDILICLWMVLAVHAFLVALERIKASESALLPCLAFAVVTALNLLTKGFIGLVFPLGFVLLYLAVTRQLRLLLKLHLLPSAAAFLAIAAPWHILAALRNPAIPLPRGLGLPDRGGWAWFYLYNEHIARFLSRRIPHDYGQVPIPIFWLLAAIWLFPWVAFLPSAIARHLRDLKSRQAFVISGRAGDQRYEEERASKHDLIRTNRKAARALLLWAGVVMIFFTLSARQEYYSLPALPALALMAGGFLARAEEIPTGLNHLTIPAGLPFRTYDEAATGRVLVWHKWLLLPLGSLCALVALFFAITAPHAKPGTDISSLLAQGGDYNLSLGHLFDLTGAAMGLFRGPLVLFGMSMAVIGPGAYLLRSARHTYAANLTLAGAATCLLLAMHSGLVRFYPTLGSEPLANAVLADQAAHAAGPADPPSLTLLDGELTSGSTILFYTRQPVHLVNGRVNGPWYGSFWPDAPPNFETEASLHHLWGSDRTIYLLTYHPAERLRDLAPLGPVRTIATSGGKAILTNRPR